MKITNQPFDLTLLLADEFLLIWMMYGHTIGETLEHYNEIGGVVMMEN